MTNNDKIYKLSDTVEASYGEQNAWFKLNDRGHLFFLDKDERKKLFELLKKEFDAH